MRTPHRQTLLIDADDTLWENNIYFEQAIAGFISFLDHQTHSPAEVRDHLNRCEHATIAQYGYGLRSFRRSLVACFEQLTQRTLTPALHDQITSFANLVSGSEIELLPAIAGTLADLSLRHTLMLVTKGDPVEQQDKLVRSGLERYFAAVEILPEKSADAYRELIVRHSLEPETTWMIGNSPRSDVNPALAAGLNAVFIPHSQTWILEHEEVAAPNGNRALLQLPSFADLLENF